MTAPEPPVGSAGWEAFGAAPGPERLTAAEWADRLEVSHGSIYADALRDLEES